MSAAYFHGGRGGLLRGSLILPPSVTGAKSCSEYGAAQVHRRDRVYITTDHRAAMLFAAGIPGGMVYLVEPVGELEPDPDCTTQGLSFQCPKARIVKAFKLRPAELALCRALLAA